MRRVLCGLFALGVLALLMVDGPAHGQGKGKGKGQGIGPVVSEAAKAGVLGRDLAELIKLLKGVPQPQAAVPMNVAKPGAAKGGAAPKKGAAK